MNLEQAQRISALSTAPSDGCTWFPDLGFSRFCVMHDHLLAHFVHRTHKLNHAQMQYMAEENILGATLTRKQADHLFREALDEKLKYSDEDINLDEYKWYSKILIKLVHIFPRKLWYWTCRNVYYFGVATWRRVSR